MGSCHTGWGAVSLLVAVACGTAGTDPTTGGGGSESGGATTQGAETSTGTTSTGADEQTETSGAGSSGTDTSSTTGSKSTVTAADSADDIGFIEAPDGGDEPECDVWAQDCRAGEKCMPWADDGGERWNATRCSPIAEDPAAVGEPCTVEGSAVSGLDDCELGAMCWFVDAETHAGTCVAFCAGSEAAPVCADPTTSCLLSNDVLALCLPTCDPLAPTCGDGLTCIAGADAFVCVEDASGGGGAFGDACDSFDACDPGLVCGAPELTPDCAGAIGCCTPLCDLDDPEASSGCPGARAGQQCLPWYDRGQAPDELDDVGVCGVPA
jgi:hypothetical protein